MRWRRCARVTGPSPPRCSASISTTSSATRRRRGGGGRGCVAVLAAPPPEREWSKAHKHTGRSDIPLTDVGRDAAVALRPQLCDRPFGLALTSPLSRARETAALAGLGPETDEDLLEWDYGDYEGITTVEVRETQPG